MISRRVVLKGIAAGTAASLFCGFRAPAAMDKHSFKARMLELEHRYGGRLGVGVLDTASNRTCTHRGHERFLMCSTFKLVAAGLILSRVDQRRESLDRRVRYHDSALVTYSPETEKHVDQGMTLAAICKAAVTLSDNTAGNLMLESFGGPDALTAYCRSLGDQVTRLDDREPLPDASESGSEANTTTPAAMLGLVQRMVLGDALSASSRRQIQSWMVANRTGDDRLRAGLPDRWRVGDKTGSGAGNTANDIAVVWPPGSKPIVVTAYYTGSKATHEQRDAILASVGETVLKDMQG